MTHHQNRQGFSQQEEFGLDALNHSMQPKILMSTDCVLPSDRRSASRTGLDCSPAEGAAELDSHMNWQLRGAPCRITAWALEYVMLRSRLPPHLKLDFPTDETQARIKALDFVIYS